MNEDNPNAILRGGPLQGAEVAARVCRVEEPASRAVKLEMGDRYEHFRPVPETEEVGGRRLCVLDWSHTTYVAE